MPVKGIIKSEDKYYPFVASSVEVDMNDNFTFNGVSFSESILDTNNNLKRLPHFTLKGRIKR
jgi:hypothetical protein